MAALADRLHIRLMPDLRQRARRRAAHTPLADFRNSDEVRIYVSYSHAAEDSRLVFGLVHHLEGHLNKMLKTTEHGSERAYDVYRPAVTIWCNRTVTAGMGWNDEIEEAEFRSAGVILLLISGLYLASEVCRQQWQRAEEQRKDGAVKVVPILLRPADWNPPSDWHLLPSNATPVSDWSQREEVFEEITTGLLAEIPADVRAKWVDRVPNQFQMDV
jgi:hypothetical protein